MSNNLKVATIAINTTSCDPDANLAALGRSLQLLEADTDLVVLPELFSTGFVSDADELSNVAQSNGGSTIKTIAELARRYNLAIAGSFAARTGNHIYNRGFFIEPSGDETFYDKHHLFSLGDEARLFTAGDHPMPLIRYRGWTIAMIICYDLRFPVWSRNRNSAYDMLIVPACWPNARAYAWEHLLIARAIENQCCVVGANRSGSDDYGKYDDSSYIFDALGKSVGTRISRRSAPAPIISATLALNDVAEIRRRLPAAADADPFQLL